MSAEKEEGSQVEEAQQENVKTEVEAGEGRQQEEAPKENIASATINSSNNTATTNAIAMPPGDMSIQIDENNSDLTARIANAINLANSMAGMNSGGGGAGANLAPMNVGQLESLFPGNATGLPQALGSNGVGAGVPTPRAAPGMPTAVAPGMAPMGAVVGAPALAPGAPAPLPGQELSLLSLLSSNSNFLTPSDMALPLNDPSIFLPTPFAPGQSANTLQTGTQTGAPTAAGVARSRLSASTPDSVSSIGSINGLPLADAIRSAASMTGAPIPGLTPATTMPGAPGTSRMPGATGLPPGMAAAMAGAAGGGAQTSFLQQLMAAYAMGGAGGQQSLFAPAIPGLQPGLMNGLLGQANPAAPAPGSTGLDLNSLLAAGYPAAALNPALAGALAGHPVQAALNPALMGLPGLGLGSLAGAAGLGGLANANLMGGNLAAAAATVGQPAVTNSSNGSAAAAQVNSNQVINNAIKSSMGAAAAASGGSLQPAEKQAKSSKKSGGGESDPLIKSREARWIIRYNELLEFRREHGHCRVPHGYASNRKLSWWVMNQRAQFAHRNQGKKTWLTDDRIQMLNDIGFIWTPHLKRSGGGGEGGKKKEKSESSENADEDENSKKRRSSDVTPASDGDDNDDDNKKIKAEV